MDMGKWRFILFQFSLIANFTISGCYANQIKYKHLPQSETEIKVDKIVTLDTEVTEVDTEVKGENSEVKIDNQEFTFFMQTLQREIQDLKLSRKRDRQRLSEMEKRLMGYQEMDKKLEDYHDEIIVSSVEVVQLRQLVTESYDRTNRLEEEAKEFRILAESYPFFEKDVRKELRRYTEYKEKAAKRFHHIENSIKRLEKEREVTLGSLEKTTQGYVTVQSDLVALRNLTHEISENVTISLSLLSTCCQASSSSVKDDQNLNSQEIHSKDRNAKGGNQESVNSPDPNSVISASLNEAEITEFGSGEVHEYNVPIPDLDVIKYNKLHLQQNTQSEKAEQSYQGSGESTAIYEGSGEGSGDEQEFLPVVDLSNYVHKTAFQMEISIREQRIQGLTEKFQNLTEEMGKLKTRVTSIQLGDFMQRLQESFINFSQNALTIDQFQMTSSRIVNSTLLNQDNIIKLTNMILENADKIADLRWKASNSELLSDQQFNILRMYVIRMNNSLEDVKDAMKKLEAGKQMTGPQYGYNAGYGAQYPYTGSNFGQQSQGTDQNLETLSSKLDHIGLQIVYNQNRLGNLEVKFLNESLYTCRKYNMDTYQDSQLAAQEAMVKANLDSILMNHELLKQLDNAVKAIEQGMKSNSRRMRGVSANLNSFRGIIPALLHMKKEVDNFLFQLPQDCSEYYQRGYRKSGVYVIHPITATSSRQVTCHMEQDGGWTVIQQRFDGSLDFNQNWTDYQEGFGEPDSEYWLGADTIYILSSNQNCSLKIEMTDIYGNTWTANYDEFKVAHPDDQFSLTVSGYHGNATDNMDYSNGFAFSTPNRDNDASGTHCAFYYKSGWWFKHCQLCNLNGRYDIGFMWFNLDSGSWIRLKSSVMKIKPQ